jgi:hypothetical protein
MGTLFRSRLEARWAVFFDLIGITWQYEPEYFKEDFGDRVIRYLPDFYLPDLQCWVEVKGTQNNLNADWDSKMRDILDYYPSPIYETLDSPTKGFLILGKIPVGIGDPLASASFTFIQHHEGLYQTKCIFLPQHQGLSPSLLRLTKLCPHKFLYDHEYPELEHIWTSFRKGNNLPEFWCAVVKAAFATAEKWNFKKGE